MGGSVDTNAYQLSPVDTIIILLCLGCVLLLGFLTSWLRKYCNTPHLCSLAFRSGSTSDFFLSGRAMPWWTIGASLFASNIGAEHFVGQAGSASASGMPVGLYEWTAIYLLLMLGWIYAPIYLRCGLTTVPEYFEQR